MLFLNFNQPLLFFLHYLIFPQLQQHRRFQMMLIFILNDRQHCRPITLIIFVSYRAFKDDITGDLALACVLRMMVWEVCAGGDPHSLFFELHYFELF